MLKMIVLLATICALMPINVASGEEKHKTWEPTASERASISWLPLKSDELLLGRFGISMPLGRILLAKKKKKYCALKFTNTWLGKTEHDHYTSYEYYYQGDESGDFTKANVLSGTDELFWPKIESVGIFFRYQTDSKKTITCGDFEFEWLFITYISFIKGELAPTPWTSVKDINIRDPRIQWYRKDANRKRKWTVPIDKLWDKPNIGDVQPDGIVKSKELEKNSEK